MVVAALTGAVAQPAPRVSPRAGPPGRGNARPGPAARPHRRPGRPLRGGRRRRRHPAGRCRRPHSAGEARISQGCAHEGKNSKADSQLQVQLEYLTPANKPAVLVVLTSDSTPRSEYDPRLMVIFLPPSLFSFFICCTVFARSSGAANAGGALARHGAATSGKRISSKKQKR